MKPAAFEYCRPDTLEEALDLLREFGDDARILAGGLSLVAMLNMRLVRPRAVIDINRIPHMGAVESADGALRTGALVRQAGALDSEELTAAVPLLAEALLHAGHAQTRSRGTLAGSAAHADPSAEVPLCLVTLGGEIELWSWAGRRRVPAHDFFRGILTTACEPHELVTSLVWPRSGAGCGFGFREVAQRRGDFAIAAAAAKVSVGADGALSEIALGLGGVEDRPIEVDCRDFTDGPANARTAREIAAFAAAAIEPMTDVKASAEFRRHLARVLAERALDQAFRDAAARS